MWHKLRSISHTVSIQLNNKPLIYTLSKNFIENWLRQKLDSICDCVLAIDHLRRLVEKSIRLSISRHAQLNSSAVDAPVRYKWTSYWTSWPIERDFFIMTTHFWLYWRGAFTNSTKIHIDAKLPLCLDLTHETAKFRIHTNQLYEIGNSRFWTLKGRRSHAMTIVSFQYDRKVFLCLAGAVTNCCRALTTEKDRQLLLCERVNLLKCIVRQYWI